MSLSQSLYVNFLSSFEAIIFKPLTRYLHRRYLKSKGGQPIWWKTFAWIWSFSCFNTVQFQSHLNADGLLWSSLCCNLSRRVKCYWTGWKHSPTKPCPLYRKPRIRWSQHETDSCKIVSGCEPKRKKAFKKKIINVYKSRGKNTISAAECTKCADLKDTKLHCGESDLTGSFLQVHVLFCTRS